MRHLKLATLLVAPLIAVPSVVNAQSNVQVGGQIKLGLDNISYSGGNASGPGSVLRVTDNSSWWFIKADEDLGDGTRAFIHFETAFSADSGNVGSGRFSAVGLSNPSWGRFLLGQWSIYFASDSMLSPEGLGNASPYSTGTLNVLGSIGKRGQFFSGGFLPNTIRYESPIWNGFSFTTAYSFDTETANQASNRTINVNPTYSNGPLTLYANYLSRNNQPGSAGNFATNYDQKSNRLGVGYLFDSGLKLVMLWDRNTVEGNAIVGSRLSRDAWAIPVSYRVGAHLVTATYGKALAYKTNDVTTADTGATMMALSYQYAFSKKTFFSASVSTMDNDAKAGYDFWYPSNVLTGPANYSGFQSRYSYLGLKTLF